MNTRKIAQAVVLGAGVMGSGIAAHLAGAGIRVTLLDMVPSALSEDERKKGIQESDKAFRNRFAIQAKANLCSPRSQNIYTPALGKKISVGNFSDDLEAVTDADWVIEVIVEKLEPKQELLKKVAAFVRPGTVISTNTSGVSINNIAKALPADMRPYFLGTHFFNPVRAMKLLELIPCNETSQELLEYMQDFGTNRLGKGVVIARDTPAFIANRIGTATVPVAIVLAEKYGFDFAKADALTGAVLDRPMGIFQLVDLVGLDTTGAVCRNIREHALDEDEKSFFALSDYYTDMIQRGWLGNKVGGGFYKKDRATRQKYMLSPEKMDYIELQKPDLTCLNGAETERKAGSRIRKIIETGTPEGSFILEYLERTFLYFAKVTPVITDDFRKIDLAMNWGYNWKTGPFRLWDEIGAEWLIDQMRRDELEVPSWVENHLKENRGTFYNDRGYSGLEAPRIYLSDRQAYPCILDTDEVSLRDIGDGVACLEFHSKGNAISENVVETALKALDIVRKDCIGLVIGNQGRNFCGGAQLHNIYELGGSGKEEEIRRQARDFHAMTMGFKYSAFPVVTAGFGAVMGGGAETALHSAKVLASPELKMGLVEARLGLLPGGGGTKELTVRAMETEIIAPGMRVLPVLTKYHAAIYQAGISNSAHNAFEMGLLRQSEDKIVMNSDRLIDEAKAEVLHMAKDYRPRIPQKVRVLGTQGEGALCSGIFYMLQGNYISEHDAFVAEKIAWVMTGGGVHEGSEVTEDYLNELETEAFIELCQMPKTRERIKAFLDTGKFIKN